MIKKPWKVSVKVDEVFHLKEFVSQVYYAFWSLAVELSWYQNISVLIDAIPVNFHSYRYDTKTKVNTSLYLRLSIITNINNMNKNNGM